jgi:hypothetical protein
VVFPLRASLVFFLPDEVTSSGPRSLTRGDSPVVVDAPEAAAMISSERVLKFALECTRSSSNDDGASQCRSYECRSL